jgi:hypothetical protein
MKRIIFLLFALPLALASCKKGEDEQLPVIQILSPANGSTADVFDTLHVSVHVSDNKQLENLRVQLVSTQMIPVLPAATFSMNGQSYDAVFDYIISNHRMASGNYYLSVEATDGNNTSRAYTNIYVTGVPRVLNGFFAATIPISGTLNIYKGDTSWNASLFTSYPSDFTDMAVSNYWQQVYTNGINTGPLKATSIDGSTTGFSIQSIAGPVPYWGPLAVRDARLWIAYRANNVFKALDQTGVPSFTSATDPGFYPELSLQWGNRVYTEQKDISSANARLVVYSTAGGGLQETPMSVDAIAMFEKDLDNIYVVGNTLGQGHLLIYDFTTNGFWEPIGLPAAAITCAAQVDSNTILIGMDNGNVYRFTYNPVGLLTWASGISPTALRYDDVNAEVYTAEGTNVKVYSYNPFALQHTIAIPYPVSDLELWFNQ